MDDRLVVMPMGERAEAQTQPYDARYLKRQPTRAQVLAAQGLIDQAEHGRGTKEIEITPAIIALAEATPVD